jgi:hypothetical protein
MKPAIFLTWLPLLAFSVQGQDYLAAFATQKATRTQVVMETFEEMTIYKISSSIYPFIAAAGEVQSKAPPIFQELALHLQSSYPSAAITEIEYMVCYEGRCATRYNVSAPEQGYLRGRVYAGSSRADVAATLKVEDIAGFFTLTELLGVLDIDNVDKSHVRWPLFEPCYIAGMENRLDMPCLLRQMASLTPEQRQDFLNRLKL